ncbi:MAG: hypothetical protein WDN24_05740 [Sphingomonas sp.]
MTVAVPDEPFEMFEPWPAKTWGSEFRRSSMRVAPVSFSSSAPTTVTGLLPRGSAAECATQ